jgi:hypothetical protein
VLPSTNTESQARRLAILDRLKPAGRNQIVDALDALLLAYPNAGTAGDAKARIAPYLLALDGISLQAIRRGVTAALQGTGPFDPRFMPLAPELAAYCRSLQTDDLAELARLRKQEEAAALLPPPVERERTPEEQARIDALVSGAIRRMEEGKTEARQREAPDRAEPKQKRVMGMSPIEAKAHLDELSRQSGQTLALSDEALAAAGFIIDAEDAA